VHKFKSSVRCSPWSCRITLLMLLLTLAAMGQQASIVPTLVNFKGILTDVKGKPLTGIVGVTICLYKDEQGGAPLWMETQNVTADKSGHYTVVLGSTTTQGLPTDLFASGEARWLGVQAQGQAEQPRVLLLSVPYALKAGDAQTVGGLPPSAFVLAAPAAIGSATASSTAASTAEGVSPLTATDVTTTGGTADFLPIFSGASTVIDSVLYQTGTGSTAKVGINTTTPATTLDVNGTGTVRGTLSLPATAAAIATAGKDSQALSLAASAFNSTSSTALNQTFRLQAEPAGNDTIAPSGTLNLLFGEGATAPSETGLKLSSKGLFTFATGQTFPGTGTITGVTTASGSGLKGGGTSGTLNLGLITTCSSGQLLKWNGSAWACAADLNSGGTVTSVGLSAPASDFKVTGSPVTTTGTLNLAWNVVPTNANTPNAIVKRDASGNFSAFNISASGVDATSGLSGASLRVTNAGSGALAAYTWASATSGNGIGIEGESDSSSTGAIGVFGNAPSITCCAAMGVEGYAGNGIGVYGVNYSPSSTGAGLPEEGAGVWGDAGTGYSPGVLATADDKQALIAHNNSPSGFATAYLEADDTTSSSNLVFQTDSPYFGGSCTIDEGGNLICTGSKSAVAPVDNGTRKVALYAIEGPENWFEDAGTGHLAKGAATITLEPVFAQTINTSLDYHVFLTPNGDCKGLYVTRKSAISFEVHELGGGTSSLDFDYRIMAKRKGYENIRLADKTEQFQIRDHLRRRAKGLAPAPEHTAPRTAKTAAELVPPTGRPATAVK